MFFKIEEKKLTSSRLWLQSYQEADTQVFFNLIKKNKHRLESVFPGRIRQVTSIDQARRFLLQFKTDWLLGKGYSFGVWHKATAQYIGDISLKNIDKSILKAEIGYYLDGKAEGNGYGIEMLRTTIQFAFEELNLNKIYLRTSLYNRRSYTLAETCGFQREGIIRQDFRDNRKQLVDVFYYGLTKADYAKIPKPEKAREKE